MIGTDKEYTLSTHDEMGKAKKHTFQHSLLGYIIAGIALFGFGFYFLTIFPKFDELFNFSIMLILTIIFSLTGIVVIIYGIKNYSRKIKITVNQQGITIEVGDNFKNAFWNEIQEISSSQQVIPVGRYVHIIRLIDIKTLSWKFRIKQGNFTINQLKEFFIKIADKAKNKNVKIVDYMNWLPDTFEFKQYKVSGLEVKKKEYKRYFLIGLVMILIGLMIYIYYTSLNISDQALVVLSVAISVIGFMLFAAGGIGYLYNVKKLRYKEYNI